MWKLQPNKWRRNEKDSESDFTGVSPRNIPTECQTHTWSSASEFPAKVSFAAFHFTLLNCSWASRLPNSAVRQLCCERPPKKYYTHGLLPLQLMQLQWRADGDTWGEKIDPGLTTIRWIVLKLKVHYRAEDFHTFSDSKVSRSLLLISVNLIFPCATLLMMRCRKQEKIFQ